MLEGSGLIRHQEDKMKALIMGAALTSALLIAPAQAQLLRPVTDGVMARCLSYSPNGCSVAVLDYASSARPDADDLARRLHRLAVTLDTTRCGYVLDALGDFSASTSVGMRRQITAWVSAGCGRGGMQASLLATNDDDDDDDDEVVPPSPPPGPPPSPSDPDEPDGPSHPPKPPHPHPGWPGGGDAPDWPDMPSWPSWDAGVDGKRR